MSKPEGGKKTSATSAAVKRGVTMKEEEKGCSFP